jgi:putative oxidoreductase
MAGTIDVDTLHHHHPAHHAQHHDPKAAEAALEAEEQLARRERERLEKRRAYVYSGGRVLLAFVFLAAAASKLWHFSENEAALVQSGVYSAALLLSVAIAIELLGGGLLALGFGVRKVAVGMLVYLVWLTLLIHGDLSVAMNRDFAVYNLGLAGGLLLLAAFGAGKHSLDAWLARRAELRFGS